MQTTIVIIIVAAALFAAVRHFARIFSKGHSAGENRSCGCSGCDGCGTIKCKD